MIKAIIFDCFGVILADSLRLLAEQKLSNDPVKNNDLKDVVDAAVRGLILSKETDQMVAELLDMTIDEYKDKKYGGETKNQQLLDYILKLKKEYKIGMLSNVGKGGLESRFSKQELDKYFDVVIASGDVGYAKPEPEIYEITAQKLGVRLDECVFTDDYSYFCEAAVSVGMKAIHYQNLNQFKRELKTFLANSNN